jgi:ketopantoate reductase
MKEMIQVANACGVPLSDSEIDTILDYASRLPAITGSSLFADYKRKQNTEVELLQGNLVRMADQYKVNAPIARTIYSLLKLKTKT